jgi:predicted GNAT family N-acyltransferase
MIRGKFLTSMDDITAIIELRRRVFCEELGLPVENEPDAHDSMSVYALVFDDENSPIGTGRLYIDDDRITIGRVCVLKEWRGRQIGDFIMRMLLYRAQELNAGSVTLTARADKVNFYAKYGFEPVGDVVHIEGIAQRVMRVDGDKINIEGSCHCNNSCQGCEGNCEACQESR